jgi:hypothetical protein
MKKVHKARRRAPGAFVLALLAAVAGSSACSGGNGNADAGNDGLGSPDRPTSRYNLDITQVATQASRVNVGDPIDVAFEVENSGELDVGAFVVEVALAKSAGDPMRIPLTRVMVPGLRAGKRYDSDPLMLPVPLDVRSGQYFVIAVADPENLIQESDETDNVGKTLLPVQIVNPLIPDLIIVKPAMGPAVALSQNSVIPGSPVTARFTVKNVGMMPVLAFKVGVYLAQSPMLDKRTDMSFGQIDVSALAGDEEKQLSMTVTLPDNLALGNYYILANADDDNMIDEGDETDNLGVSDPLTVRMPPAHFTDLVATDIHVRNQDPTRNPQSFYYGDRLQVDATFKNLGDVAAGFFATKVFLSTDQNFDPPTEGTVDGGPADGGMSATAQDVLFVTFNTDGVPGHSQVMQSKSRDVSPTIPPGSYYVILQVNSEMSVDESDFFGNDVVVLDTPITITGNPPPPPNDTCAQPQAITFDAGGMASVSASNQYALADYTGSCGGGGPDLVYTFTTTVPRSLHVTVGGIDAVVYLRKTDCANGMDMGLCAASRDLVLKSLDPGVWYLIVGGTDTTQAGPFNLTVATGDPVPAAYVISQVPAAFTDISAAGTALDLGGDTDSGCADTPIGFSFPFFQATFTTVQVNADGYLRFGASSCQGFASNAPLPDPGDPNNIAAVFWDDLGGGTGRNIYALPMSDRLVVQYSNWSVFVDDTSSLNFQAILHLNGNIEYQYGSMTDPDNPPAAQGQSAAIGVENSDGSDGYQYSFDSPSITAPSGVLFTRQ